MPLNSHDTAFLQDILPFWNKLTPPQRQLIQSGSAPHNFRAKDIIHSGPDDCAGLYCIKSGQVRSFILSDTGREITLFRLFERDVCIFSASCVLKNIRFDIYSQAVEDSETILIPTAIYRDLNQNSLAVSDFTNQLISSRLSDVMWLLEQILFMSFDRRLAIYLLEQSSIDGSDRLKTTHEEIARNMGSAREVVTRMLRYFQSEGMVKLSRGEVELTDRKKLEKMAKAK